MLTTILAKKLLFSIPSYGGDIIVEAELNEVSPGKYVAQGTYKHDDDRILQIHNIAVLKANKDHIGDINQLVNLEYGDNLLIEYEINVEEV